MFRCNQPGITQDTFEFLPGRASSYCPAGLPVNTVCSVNTGGHPYDAVVTCILLRAWELGQDNFDFWSRAGHAKWQPGRDLYKSIWSNDKIDLLWGINRDETININIILALDSRCPTYGRPRALEEPLVSRAHCCDWGIKEEEVADYNRAKEGPKSHQK